MGVELPIYLDHHATTPTDPRVLEAMLPHFTREFGNAASRSHVFGWRAEAAVEVAREALARALGAGSAEEIVFTSGATESVNLALQGALRATRGRADHLVTVATEHRAVLDTAQALEAEGFAVTRLPVAGDGLVDPDDVARAIGPRTRIVSVMAANNEIGVLQPLEAIGRLCRERGVLFHTDATQALGKVELDVERMSIDLLSCSAHKLYGPKGVGALYLRTTRPRLRLAPILHGGGHERGLRPGTLPVPLIVGFGRAVELCLAERESEAARLRALGQRLQHALEGGLDGVALNGHAERRLPGSLNLSFAGVEATVLIAALPQVALSTGSACTSAHAEPSHVLRALGLEEERVRSSLRFGLGRSNGEEEIDWVAERIVQEVRRLRAARHPERDAAALLAPDDR